MPPKAKKKAKRKLDHGRNLRDNGDLIKTDRGITVVIGDDDTVTIDAPGFASEIDLQHSVAATPDAPAVSQVRVRLRPAPYVPPGAPSDPLIPGRGLDPEEVTPGV